MGEGGATKHFMCLSLQLKVKSNKLNDKGKIGNRNKKQNF